MTALVEAPHQADVLSRLAPAGNAQWNGFPGQGSLHAPRGCSGFPGFQAPLPATCGSSHRYQRSREARPASWGEGRLQSYHCKQVFINYKWTGSPELL